MRNVAPGDDGMLCGVRGDEEEEKKPQKEARCQHPYIPESHIARDVR
jgi:hypothetical protein